MSEAASDKIKKIKKNQNENKHQHGKP